MGNKEILENMARNIPQLFNFHNGENNTHLSSNNNINTEENFEDMVNTSFGKTQIRESVTKDAHHCFRVFNMHPDVAEKLESLAEEEPDWLVQFTPNDKNYFLLTTSEVKSKDQFRKLIDVEASYQAQMLF